MYSICLHRQQCGRWTVSIYTTSSVVIWQGASLSITCRVDLQGDCVSLFKSALWTCKVYHSTLFYQHMQQSGHAICIPSAFSGRACVLCIPFHLSQNCLIAGLPNCPESCTEMRKNAYAETRPEYGDPVRVSECSPTGLR